MLSVAQWLWKCDSRHGRQQWENVYNSRSGWLHHHVNRKVWIVVFDKLIHCRNSCVLLLGYYRKCVQHFLQKVHSEYAPYGGGVNPLKTRYVEQQFTLYGINLSRHIAMNLYRVKFPCELEINGSKVSLRDVSTEADNERLSWCGYYINTKTLEVITCVLLLEPLQHHLTWMYNPIFR